MSVGLIGVVNDGIVLGSDSVSHVTFKSGGGRGLPDGRLPQLTRTLRAELNAPLLPEHMPLAEAIRTVQFLIETEVRYSYHLPDPEPVAGEPQIASISPRHGFQWYVRPGWAGEQKSGR